MKGLPQSTIKIINKKALKVKELILTISHKAHVGHIGSALSIADILTVLYTKILHINPGKTRHPDRDRFILSKGHAVAALYSILYLQGFITKKSLNSYCRNNGTLGEHPEFTIPGIELSTGSLGHGLSVGVGMAMAAKLNNKGYKTYVLISDAECNEGEIWQAAAVAAHHRLNNLIVIIDNNHVQALGKTKEVLNYEPLADKWTAFGWNTVESDGHDIKSLCSVFAGLVKQQDKPTVIIANTIRGKGVSFMQHKIQWHYLSTTNDQYHQAIAELRKNLL